MRLPQTVIASYRGIPSEVDLLTCRRALVQRQVEGEHESM
jgi:hypothetical protein